MTEEERKELEELKAMLAERLEQEKPRTTRGVRSSEMGVLIAGVVMAFTEALSPLELSETESLAAYGLLAVFILGRSLVKALQGETP